MLTKPATILIIEGQARVHNALTMTLLAEEFGIKETIWDSQKIDVAVHLFPDLILFLVGAPGRGDLEAISSLRKMLPAISIIAFISGEFPGQEQAALDHGANLVVKKPIPRSTLVHILKKISNEQVSLNLENQWIN